MYRQSLDYEIDTMKLILKAKIENFSLLIYAHTVVDYTTRVAKQRTNYNTVCNNITRFLSWIRKSVVAIAKSACAHKNLPRPYMDHLWLATYKTSIWKIDWNHKGTKISQALILQYGTIIATEINLCFTTWQLATNHGIWVIHTYA